LPGRSRATAWAGERRAPSRVLVGVARLATTANVVIELMIGPLDTQRKGSWPGRLRTDSRL